MHTSEDEYDSRQGFDQEERQHVALSKAELRKTNKPIMEKKRRARINQCLGELKDLILEAMKKDPSRHSKLEKADILEMTVKHLQALQRRGLAAAAITDPDVLPRYRQGFSDCAAEATRFLSRPPGLPAPARARLRQHLTACMSALHHPQASNLPHDLNGNIHVSGVPLIPSRLPTGELALVLPPNAQFTRPFPDLFQQNDSHISAFQTVRSSNRPPSPASSISSSDSLSSERGTPPNVSVSANTFPTPPSQSSFNDSSPETQKPVVSSTTISPESTSENKNVDMGRKRGTLWRQTDVQSPPKITEPSVLDYSVTPCRKKSYAMMANSANALSDTKLEPPVKKIACTQVSSSQNLEEGKSTEEQKDKAGTSSSSQTSNDMWRPW